MIRALLIAVFFFTVTPILISLQWLLGKLGLPGWGFIASNYYRVLRAILRIRVRVNGTPVRGRAVLYVSNHVSWADIVVIGSLSPVAFVAKREVASWPLVGITARMQRTVFVDRTRRHQAADAVQEIVARLGLRHVCRLVRGRHIERRQPRAAVPLGAGRRGEGGRSARRHRHPADVDLLHRPAWHADGPAQSPAGGVVRRSRLSAPHPGLDCARRHRRGGQLRRAGDGRAPTPTARPWPRRWKHVVRALTTAALHGRAPSPPARPAGVLKSLQIQYYSFRGQRAPGQAKLTQRFATQTA